MNIKLASATLDIQGQARRHFWRRLSRKGTRQMREKGLVSKRLQTNPEELGAALDRAVSKRQRACSIQRTAEIEEFMELVGGLLTEKEHAAVRLL